MGGVGSPMRGAGVGHVDFMFLFPFHLCWFTNVNSVPSGIWALLFCVNVFKNNKFKNNKDTYVCRCIVI